MTPEFYLEQQTDQAGVLIDSYLVLKTVGIIEGATQLPPVQTVGLGSLINKDTVQKLINNSGFYVSIELPATFKR